MYVGAGTGISLVYQANLFLQLSISGSEQSEPSTWPVVSGLRQYLTSRHCFSTVGWTSKKHSARKSLFQQFPTSL